MLRPQKAGTSETLSSQERVHEILIAEKKRDGKRERTREGTHCSTRRTQSGKKSRGTRASRKKKSSPVTTPDRVEETKRKFYRQKRGGKSSRRSIESVKKEKRTNS